MAFFFIYFAISLEQTGFTWAKHSPLEEGSHVKQAHKSLHGKGLDPCSSPFGGTQNWEETILSETG